MAAGRIIFFYFRFKWGSVDPLSAQIVVVVWVCGKFSFFYYYQIWPKMVNNESASGVDALYQSSLLRLLAWSEI